MPDDKKTTTTPLEQSGTNADERVAALLRTIQRELDEILPLSSLNAYMPPLL